MFKTRNILSLLLALMLVFSLAACSSTEKNDEPTNDDAAVDNNNTTDDTITDDTVIDDTTDDTVTDDTTDEGVVEEDTTEEDTTEPEVEEETDTPADDTNTDAADGELAAFFETLGVGYEMAMLDHWGADMVDAFLPGMNDIAVSESLFAAPMMSAVVCEIYMVKCENADDTAKVAEIFEARKQAQVDGGAWYPESIATWELAEIVVSGNYVALFAHPNAAEMAADFDNAF